MSLEHEEKYLEIIGNNDHWALYKFFLLFPGVGQLISLLLVGDTIECNLLPPVEAEVWGAVIAEVNSGGKCGLVQLELINKDSAKKADIQLAFAELFNYISDKMPWQTQ
ncbi:unnamed protein product [Cyclocybe aegerita]|uniref:Uncharacterized protein n=1 Tax=Cyclocybe aegerita TaxID=1973307 RepID=A0A8S0XI77_CYCAE|nr:unnamed protein product [Cyclocybe aegerita]